MSEDTTRASLRFPYLLTLAVTLLARLAYWPPQMLGKDGPAYVNALNLDSTFSVPMPGNIGWVLLGKLFSFFTDPVSAYTLVTFLISLIGTSFIFLLCTLFLRPWMAAITTLAAALSPMIWFHAEPLLSYGTWIAIPPAIAYFGIRYSRQRKLPLLYAAAAATGLGTILRPDMVAFAGPLLGGILLITRPPILKGWAVCTAICFVCCLFWFFTTAAILGGPSAYLARVNAQTDYIATYGPAQKGFYEGLIRNAGKYAIFFVWGGLFVTPLALLGLCKLLAAWRTTWQWIILGALALAPSFYFGVVVFMGNAGLAMPGLLIAFLLAAYWLEHSSHPRRRYAMLIMGIVGALGAAQFIFTPVLPARNQRNIILMALGVGYSGNTIRRMYEYNPADFGVDSSVANALRQFRNPEPVPFYPPGFPDDLR